MSQINKDGYTNVAHNPSRHDSYILKTQEGTYEFGFFDGNNWTIKGDNNGATPFMWAEIPTTDASF